MESTTQRGDAFRDTVVSLLEAAGMRCVAEVREDFKKVDIIVRAEDVDGTVTILIEAKDYAGALPKSECVAFVAEYGTLAKASVDRRAWLVSRNAVSPDGRALVEAAGLKCFTYDELQRRMLRLNAYVEELIATYERERIAEFYVPPHAKTGEELSAIIDEWLADDHAEPIAIMGGYGIGKTTFATHLAASLGRKALDDATARVPILIPLGEVFDDQSIDGLVGKVLASKHRVPGYHFSLFEVLNAAGRFVIIFDGFDEMKHGMTLSQFERNVAEFMRLDQGRAKIVLLGRDTAFHSELEFRAVIRGRLQTAGGTVVRARGRRGFRSIALRGFNLEEARRYVEQYFPIRATEAARQNGAEVDRAWIDRRRAELLDGSLDPLLDRPVHSQMLCEIATQPEVPIAGISKNKLYDLFVHFLLEREVTKRGRYPEFGIETRRRFNAALAWWLWERGFASTTTAAVDGVSHEFDGLTLRRELIAGCLVDKGGDTIFFGHRSIQEFLAAEYLVSTDLLADRADAKAIPRLRTVLSAINPEMIDFVVGMLREPEWDVETITRWLSRLLLLDGHGIPLSGINLFARILNDARLRTEPGPSPWEYWLYHFALVDRAEFAITPEAMTLARERLEVAFNMSRDLSLAACVYWAHAIRLDRGNSRELTAALVARMLPPEHLKAAFAKMKGNSDPVWISKSVDLPFWLLLSTWDLTGTSARELRVTIDVDKLIDLAEQDLGIGFDRGVSSDEVRTVRRAAFCIPSDIIRAVADSNRDQNPVRLLFDAPSWCRRLIAGEPPSPVAGRPRQREILRPAGRAGRK